MRCQQWEVGNATARVPTRRRIGESVEKDVEGSEVRRGPRLAAGPLVGGGGYDCSRDRAAARNLDVKTCVTLRDASRAFELLAWASNRAHGQAYKQSSGHYVPGVQLLYT